MAAGEDVDRLPEVTNQRSAVEHPVRPKDLEDLTSSGYIRRITRFQLPEGCHWDDVRETPANVGAALARAMQEIERANPDTLYGVFGTADWGNREKFTDELLKDLLEGFSAIQLNGPRAHSESLWAIRQLGETLGALIAAWRELNTSPEGNPSPPTPENGGLPSPRPPHADPHDFEFSGFSRRTGCSPTERISGRDRAESARY